MRPGNTSRAHEDDRNSNEQSAGLDIPDFSKKVLKSIKSRTFLSKVQSTDQHVETRQSMALSKLFDKLTDHAISRAQDALILDLGPARQHVVELTSRFPFELHISDIVSTLDLVDAHPETNHTERCFTEQDWVSYLPEKQQQGFSAVLSWDLFNYLGIADIESLARCLGPRCMPGARIHSIAYTSVSMPESPLNYELLIPANLYRKRSSMENTPSPQYGAGLIEEVMPEFSIEHLYQHGLDAQEQVYQYTGEGFTA